MLMALPVEIAAIKSELRVLKWMVGATLACLVAILVRVYVS